MRAVLSPSVTALLLLTLCRPGWSAEPPAVPGPGAAPAAAEMALSMDDAVITALQSSFRTQRAQRSHEMTQMRVASSRAQKLPRFDSYFSMNETTRWSQYSNPYGSGTQNATGSFQAGLTAIVTMPIDISGVLERQIRQSELGLQSSALYLRQASVDVTAEVRATYVDALRAQGAVDADEAVVNGLQALTARARTARHPALAFLELELANAQQQLEASRASADTAQSGLRQQLRLPASTRFRLTTRLSASVPAVDLQTLTEEALARRTDVRDAQLRLAQAELALTQARDNRKPSANLFGFANESRNGLNPGQMHNSRYRSWMLSLNVQVPLAMWDGGTMERAERVAALSLAQAQDDVSEIRDRVAMELRQLMVNLEQAKRRLARLPSTDFALESLRQAEQALLSSAEWQPSMAQVTNARNVWRLAHTASIEALADYYVSYYRLLRSTGEH